MWYWMSFNLNCLKNSLILFWGIIYLIMVFVVTESLLFSKHWFWVYRYSNNVSMDIYSLSLYCVNNKIHFLVIKMLTYSAMWNELETGFVIFALNRYVDVCLSPFPFHLHLCQESFDIQLDFSLYVQRI